MELDILRKKVIIHNRERVATDISAEYVQVVKQANNCNGKKLP